MAVLGALIIGCLRNALDLQGVHPFIQNVIIERTVERLKEDDAENARYAALLADHDKTIAKIADAATAGGDDVMAKIEGSNPALAGVVVFAMLMGSASVVFAALLYPAYQALMLRWWSSGLRFGDVAMTSKLRTAQVYGAYIRFLWYAILFSIVAAILGGLALLAAGFLVGGDQTSVFGEVAATLILLGGYVILALGFSTVYRATALLSLWQLGMESLQLSGLSALDQVKASGRASSAIGEGLADALNTGGY